MKIEPTSILSDAKKIANINQHYYQHKSSETKQTKSHSSLLKQVDILKQKLFSIQSNISEQQSLKEGLKEIKKELNYLKNNYSTNNLKKFHQNVYNISKKYSYNQTNLISKDFFILLNDVNLPKDNIEDIISNITQANKDIYKKIEKEKYSLLKLQVSTENIMSINTSDKNLFNEIRKSLDHTSSQIMQKVHMLKSNEQVEHLLS